MIRKPPECAPPFGLVIQPGCLLVPGRTGYVPETRDGSEPPYSHIDRRKFEIAEWSDGHGALICRWLAAGSTTAGSESGALIAAISVTRWDLSLLTEAELDSLQVALDAQRSAGVGVRCPATVAERRALGVDR